MVNAKQYAPSCPQYKTAIPFIGNQVVSEITINGPVAEDCLTLNVFTPIRAKDLPVLVFLPGGGFMTVVPTSTISGQVIGLNIFGFPNAARLTEQNLGALDQRAGLEWVRANIHDFGGDPSKITLMGQSAGAASADGHNFAYREDPIYTGYFGMSGTVFIGALPHDQVHSNFTFVANAVGCQDLAPLEELECMRKVSHQAITAAIQSWSDGGAQAGLFNFVPTPDENTMFADYIDRYKQGKVSNRPAIYSACENEGLSLIPYDASRIDQTMANTATLNMFQCPAALSTALRSALNLMTYRYLYSGNFSNVSPLPWLAACHGADVPMLFGAHRDYTNGQGGSTKLEYETSKKLQDFLLAFMQDPHHGLDALHWPPTSSGKILRFGADGKAVQQISTESADLACE